MIRFFSKEQIAIEITSRAIKWAHIRFEQGIFVLENAQIIPIEDNNFDIVKQELLKLKSRYNLKRVIGGALGKDVNVKNFLLPDLDKLELKQAINLKIEESLAYPLEEYVLNATSPEDVYIKGKSEPYKLVVVLAIKKKYLETLSALLESVGLQIDFIDAQPRALYKLFSIGNCSKNYNSVGFLDIGFSSTNFCVYEKGIIRYARDFPFGLNNNEDILEYIKKLKKYLQESIEYYHKMFGIRPIDALFLTGGGAENVFKYWDLDAFGFDVKVLEIDKIVYNKTNLKGFELNALSVVIGFACINKREALLKPASIFERVQGYTVKNWKIVLSSTFIILTLLHFIWYFLLGWYFDIKIKKIEKEIDYLKVDYKKILTLKDKIKEEKEREDLLTYVTKRDFQTGIFFLYMSNFSSKNINLFSIEKNKNNFVFKGKSLDFKSVSMFTNMLSKYTYIKDAHIDVARLDKNGFVNFSIIAKGITGGKKYGS